MIFEPGEILENCDTSLYFRPSIEVRPDGRWAFNSPISGWTYVDDVVIIIACNQRTMLIISDKAMGWVWRV